MSYCGKSRVGREFQLTLPRGLEWLLASFWDTVFQHLAR